MTGQDLAATGPTNPGRIGPGSTWDCAFLRAPANFVPMIVLRFSLVAGRMWGRAE